MTHEEVKDALVSWFAGRPAPYMRLPDGYFGGRAGESCHKLTFVAARPHKLLVELDEQVLLVFTECHAAVSEEFEFSISDFRQLTVDGQEYVNMKPFQDTYGPGTVKFELAVRRNRTGNSA